MRTVAIIQARMGSTRLPGKVLKDLCGKTALERVIERVQGATRLDDLVVATTTLGEDDVIEKVCGEMNVACFRGSKDDVLDRYYQAAHANKADSVVRITSDCPVIDPALVDQTIELLQQEGADFAATDVPGTIPRGNDVEAFTIVAFARCASEANKPHEREHVTPYFYAHPERFRLATLTSELDCLQYRWTLDTLDDYDLLREIYKEFANQPAFGWREIVDLMRRRPELMQWNAGVIQKPLK
jgi:spore coat polysaccharide biosynthesis protein SpsF